VDAAGEFLVDLGDLANDAVLPVGGVGAGVLELDGRARAPVRRP